MLPLRRETEIQKTFHQGQRFYARWAVLHARPRRDEETSPALPRVTVVTTRDFPNSVLRNRAKRLVRETCRAALSEGSGPWDVVFVVRPGVLSTTFPQRRRGIVDLLRQAGVLAEKAATIT